MAGAALASRRRRRPETWVVFGAILGPAALVLLQLAPPGRCWSCAAPTEGWLTLCPWCGEDVREPARQVPEEDVRIHGPLTVIDGTAPGMPAGPGRTLAARNALARSAPADPGRVRSDELQGERRIEIGGRRPFAAPAARARSGPPLVIEPSPDPVHRLKARLGGSGQLATAQVVPAPAIDRRAIVLASAIYVTGSRGLQAGSRYGIAIVGDVLRILGPVDVDPAAIAMAHPMRGIDATGIQGRLIITSGRGRWDGLALAFMSIAGGSAETIADAIVAAVGELGVDPR